MDLVKEAKQSVKSRPIEKILSPLEDFSKLNASGGIVLLICTAIALVLANSPYGQLSPLLYQTPK